VDCGLLRAGPQPMLAGAGRIMAKGGRVMGSMARSLHVYEDKRRSDARYGSILGLKNFSGLSHVDCGVLLAGLQPALARRWAGLAGSWPRVAGSWEAWPAPYNYVGDKSGRMLGLKLLGSKRWHLARGLWASAGRTTANAGGDGLIMAKGDRIMGSVARSLHVYEDKCRSDARCGSILGSKRRPLARGLRGSAGRTSQVGCWV
jgi:hypothetical protein